MNEGEDIFANLEEEEEAEDKNMSTTINRGLWSKKEIRRLLLGIKKYGMGNWAAITDLVKTR